MSSKFSLIKRKLYKLPFIKKTIIPFSNFDHTGLGSNVIYAPHPFTNWSLNPGYKNNEGNLDHTKEGFRKVNYDSIYQISKNIKKIYCLGGSTTYCTALNSYKQSWPYLLWEKLNPDANIEVINAGVGGWGTLQSLIRFSSWGQKLKPNLTIIYQAKNDLTFYYNGNPEEKEVYPDYSNIIGHPPISQFTRVLLNFIPLDLVSLCYGKNMKPNRKNLLRYKKESFDSSIARYLTIINIAKTWGGKILFIPEIINGSPYFDYVNKLNMEALKTIEKEKNCFIFNLEDKIIKNKENFMDKMHFTKKGCSIFSNLITNFIRKNQLL